MNTAEIGAFIKNPQGLGLEQIVDLRKLCEAHPYSGLLHLLYLKALGNAKSLDFDRELNSYAIKIPNRELLYSLIHNELVSNALTPEEFLTQETTFELSNQPITSEIEENLDSELSSGTDEFVFVDISAIHAKTIVEIDIESQHIQSKNELESEKMVDKSIEDDKKQFNDLKESSEYQLITDDGFDEDQAVESFEIEQMENKPVFSEQLIDSNNDQNKHFAESSAEINLEEISWVDNTITFDGFADSHGNDDSSVELEPQKEPITIEEIPLIQDSISFDMNSEDLFLEHTPETKDNRDELSAIKDQSSSSKRSFYDWLNVPKSNINQIDLENTTSKLVPQLDVSEAVSLETDSAINLAVESEMISENSKEKVQSLVDKFIESEPRISKPKAAFFSPVKSAKESVNEEGIPISETLAKIYELQGNYPKAIAVLEKLVELLPNKRLTFEIKISEIRSKIEG